jgi:hypothetical protein
MDLLVTPIAATISAMEGAPTLSQEAPIGYLMRQGMLEGVLEVGTRIDS